ncbi:hypothetical protein ACO0QE_002997 [Hanseniaspora vineae]
MTYSYVKDYQPVDLKNSNLFKPIKLNDKITLEHRITMAPLTRFRADDNGVPNKNDWAETYYAQRSVAPGTLIISEGAYVCAQAGGAPNAPGVYTEEQMKEWAKIFAKIHEKKSYIYVQLWNLGRQASPAYLKSQGLKFVGATDNLYMDEQSKKEALDCGNELKGLTLEELEVLKNDYVKAAKNCIEYGADGVEIHSANGYMLNQFLDPLSNQRTDKYGGSIENRSKFVLEVVDAIVDAVGADKVGIRLSPYGTYGTMSGGANPLIVAQFAHIIGELEKRGKEEPSKRLSYIHIVEPRVPNPNFAEGTHEYLDGTNEFVFSIWKGLVMRAGNYALDNKTALKDVNTNDRTLLAYGRYFISNPDLVERLEKGLPLTKYDRDTFYTKESKGYTDYPNFK